MNEIEKIYPIKAPLEKVWWALTSAEGANAWGASPAKYEASVGGAFSYWDGDIHGITTVYEPERLLVQDWFGHDDPNEKYQARFEFSSAEGVTSIKLTFSGNIKDPTRDANDWDDYYFSPIKQALES